MSSVVEHLMTVTRITDFTAWDLRNEFSDWETAYLWFGFEPNYSANYPDHPSNVIGLRAALGEAVQRRELVSQVEEDRSGRYIYHDKWGRERGIYVAYPPNAARYSRQALKQWAERKGQRPLFLFPEDRQETKKPTASPSDATLGAQRREQLKQFAAKNQDRQSERANEWARWEAEAQRIQAQSPRRLSKTELAKRVKASLGLTDAVDTIRQRI
jgi:hypothetical protein